MRILDLFCGAGGAAMGYALAGHEVVGVDINPQPRYPFEFHQADALLYPLEGFDVIHASPPCHRYSTVGKQSALKLGTIYPDLVPATRDRLRASGVRWIIENVVGAPLINPIMLCGSSFGLDLKRHRLFETGRFRLIPPSCNHGWQTPRFRSLDKRRAGKLSRVVGVHGHINYSGERELRERAMQITWMNPHELTQAIPPAYTHWIGKQLHTLEQQRLRAEEEDRL